MHNVFGERRTGGDRRVRSFSAYWHGACNPRRRDWRRTSDATYPVIDWHSPRIFASVVAILLLSVCDGVLTVMLLAQGAVEVNPFMAKFVPHSLGWFAAVKLSLTGVGVAVLAACSRMKLFRSIPGELLLGVVLIGYVVLVTYELRLLASIEQTAL
jgi:hypothetical protein